MLKNPGVDVTIFGSHSTKSASTAKRRDFLCKERIKQLDDHLLRRLRNITINRLPIKVKTLKVIELYESHRVVNIL